MDFTAVPSVALNATDRANLLNPLINQLMPLSLASQPSQSSVYNELDSLVSGLSVCSGTCTAERTRTIAKASCAAVLASAVMLVQ